MPANAISQFLGATTSPRQSRILTTILLGGLSAGVLDISAACISGGLRGRSPVWVLQSVAGGLLGRTSFQGGLRTAALGLVLHLVIAIIWAAAYTAASLKMPLLARQPIVCGMLYGIIVYLCMYMIVLPLSALHFQYFSQPGSAILTAVLIHIFCVGLPIALVVRWRAR